MFKFALSVFVVTSALAGFTSGGFAKEQTAEHNRMCESIFATNQAKIESLVAVGNITGVQSVFVQANCPEFASLMKIKCRAKILPPEIICTFGARLSTNTIN